MKREYKIYPNHMGNPLYTPERYPYVIGHWFKEAGNEGNLGWKVDAWMRSRDEAEKWIKHHA